MLENYSLENWKNGINTVGLEISSDCNLRCKYCYYYRAAREGNQPEMVSDTLFYANIDRLLNTTFFEFPNVKSIDFWGAEPLLHIARIKYVVKYVIEKRECEEFNFLISSNMFHNQQIYDSFYEALDEFDIMLEGKNKKISFSIQTSIDFPASIHNKYRTNLDGKHTFSTVKHNYLAMMKKISKKNYKHISFAFFTKSTYNYQELSIEAIKNAPYLIADEILKDLPVIAECKERCSKFNYNIDYFATPATGIGYTLEEGLKNYAYYEKIFDNFEHLYLNGQLTYANAMFFLPGHLRIFISDLLCLPSLEQAKDEYPVCRSGVTFVGVRNNGDLFPCHHFFSMTERENFRIGNIFKQEYNEEIILQILNNYFIVSETYGYFEQKVFVPKYSQNLKYGSLSNISRIFYKMILRHFCFAENCEYRGNWSAVDLDSWLKIYPVQLVELILKFISKYRKVFSAVADKQFQAVYGDK